MKPYVNMDINVNNNMTNIRQIKTQFNPYDPVEERNTTGGMINISTPSLAQRNDVMSYRPNKIINKGLSDYSTSSVPNKVLLSNSYNYNYSAMPTIKTSNNLTNNYNNNIPLVQELPQFLDKSQNMNNRYNNLITLQKGLSKSSSTPSFQNLGKVNQNFYQNQAQTQYYNNNYNNQNLQNKINNINLDYQYHNGTNKINSSHTSFMNYTHNPNYNINNAKVNNYNYNFNNTNPNILTRNNSSQINNFGYMTQNNDEIRYQQLMNQKRLQEQQRMLLLQRTKMNNINYNTFNNNNTNINNMNNNVYNINNNISRNPNFKQNNQIPFNPKNLNDMNFAQVNVLEQKISSKTGINNNNQNVQNIKNVQKSNEPMNNYKNRNLNQMNHVKQANQINHVKQMNQVNQINLNPNILKQSHSQQIIRQIPSVKKNEITQQQIALAQMASLQNSENAKLVSLNQKYLDSSGNEETQSQFEREKNAVATQEETVRSKNLKIEKEPEKSDEKSETSKIQTTSSISKQKEQDNIDDDEEDPEAEKLFRLENGHIIFRNGLLRGIIHKYKEIDDIVSKIQLKLMAGVKFMLLYRASEDGDKAKIFHEKCDNHKMTLVLVETTKGVRFGGFTTKTWDGNCIKKIDNDAFVFSLDKRKCYDIIKDEFAIGGYPKFGPVFFGCQIRVYDEFFTKGGTTCNRGLNYKTKKDYELNNGEQKYVVKEIEVYDIESIEV